MILIFSRKKPNEEWSTYRRIKWLNKVDINWKWLINKRNMENAINKREIIIFFRLDSIGSIHPDTLELIINSTRLWPKGWLNSIYKTEYISYWWVSRGKHEEWYFEFDAFGCWLNLVLSLVVDGWNYRKKE